MQESTLDKVGKSMKKAGATVVTTTKKAGIFVADKAVAIGTKIKVLQFSSNKNIGKQAGSVCGW